MEPAKGTELDPRLIKIDKEMMVDRQVTRNLAYTGNAISTINGGTVFPVINSEKREDHTLFEIRVPSVDVNNIKVEVNGEHLFIFQHLLIGGVQMPNILGTFKLSGKVIVDEISAEYEDELLSIKLPTNGSSDGFRKKIEIVRH